MSQATEGRGLLQTLLFRATERHLSFGILPQNSPSQLQSTSSLSGSLESERGEFKSGNDIATAIPQQRARLGKYYTCQPQFPNAASGAKCRMLSVFIMGFP